MQFVRVSRRPVHERLAGRALLCLGMSFAVCLPLASCARKSVAASGNAAKSQAVPVVVATAIQTNVPVQFRTIGHVNPYATVSIMSQVDGELAKVHFQQGDEVKQGDLIFEIDPGTYEAALHQAEGILAKDAALEKKAELDVRRSDELFASKIEAASDHEQALANAESLKAAVLADRASVENTKLLLSYCRIRSPISGRAGRLLVNAGNIIKKQDSTLLVINQIKPIYVDFSAPENQLPAIRKYLAACKLKVEASGPRQEHPSTGELLLINNMVDPNTGSISLRASFPNTDEMLWPGQFVDVTLTLTTQTNVVVAPAQAVQNSQNGESVFVVKPDLLVEERRVTVGSRLGGNLVLEKGVNPGEQVVVSGQLRLLPGARVEISKAAESLPSSSPDP